jgi:6-phosphogluconolactonase
METAAERIAGSARQAIARAGRFTWALSGGSTPRRLYTLLASARFAKRVDWSHVHFFWSDERCVPPEDAESNYRMARETLLDAVKPPPENVHRILGEAEPSRAATSYEEVLREHFHAREDASPPRFDLVLLGMGTDGHTASLFPGTAPLFDKTRWVMANHVEEISSWRVTLTPVIINAAEQIVFLVVGADKADRLKQVLQRKPDVEALPAQLIQPTHGELLWLVDADAGARLEPGS